MSSIFHTVRKCEKSIKLYFDSDWDVDRLKCALQGSDGLKIDYNDTYKKEILMVLYN